MVVGSQLGGERHESPEPVHATISFLAIMIGLERVRLAAAGLLCSVYLSVYGYTLYIDREAGWPVSIYPMFSEGRAYEPLQVLRVFGVTKDAAGESEHRIYNEHLHPLDAIRLLDGLTRLTPQDQAEELRYVLRRNPRFSAMRLYLEDWEAGGQKVIKRKLLVDVTR